jgi:hypothetical protein
MSRLRKALQAFNSSKAKVFVGNGFSRWCNLNKLVSGLNFEMHSVTRFRPANRFLAFEKRSKASGKNDFFSFKDMNCIFSGLSVALVAVACLRVIVFVDSDVD